MMMKRLALRFGATVKTMGENTRHTQQDDPIAAEHESGSSAPPPLPPIDRSTMDRPLAAVDQRYCLLFEQSLAAIYRTTLGGQILDCNESMAAMLGYSSRDELKSRNASDLYFGTADRTAFLEQLRRDGRLKNAECRLKCKDGTAIYVLENVSLVPDESGELRIIQGNMVDITARKQMEHALRENEQRYRELSDELRHLTHHLQSVRDQERERIAREIHDELGQALTALHMDLHWLRARCHYETGDLGPRVAAMIELLGRTMQATHRICADLRPALLDDVGLPAAIEWQSREFERRTGIRIGVTLPHDALPVPRDQATAVFRIFQESLTNITRHANASRANISMDMSEDTLTLTVHDNGTGIDPQAATKPDALGLMGMRERAMAWGGRVDVSGAGGRGTTVHLTMPLAPCENGTKT
jgi:PAS domain S-box-containing protein